MPTKIVTLSMVDVTERVPPDGWIGLTMKYGDFEPDQGVSRFKDGVWEYYSSVLEVWCINGPHSHWAESIAITDKGGEAP